MFMAWVLPRTSLCSGPHLPHPPRAQDDDVDEDDDDDDDDADGDDEGGRKEEEGGGGGRMREGEGACGVISLSLCI